MPEATPVANPTPETPVVEAPKKWSAEYQLKDDNGQPLGRPTKLGPFDTPEELIAAQQKAHEEATKAYFKLKNRKPDPVVPRADFKPKTLTADEEFQLAQDLKQPSTARKAFRKLLEAEIGAPVEEQRESQKIAPEILTQREVDQFLAIHAGKDYQPCDANKQAMADYLWNNKMAVTVNNLEIALETLMAQEQLIPVPSLPTNNEAPAQQEANPLPAVRQTTSPAGLMPGSFSGSRNPQPSSSQPDDAAFKAEVMALKNTFDGREKFKRLIKNPDYLARVNKAFSK